MPSARDLGSYGAADSATTLLTDHVDEDDTDDVCKITLTSAATLNVGLSNMTDDANTYVVKDANNDGINDNGDFIAGTFNQNSSGDRAFGTNLTAGTYFIWTYRQEPGNSTDYTMSPGRLSRHDPADRHTRRD